MTAVSSAIRIPSLAVLFIALAFLLAPAPASAGKMKVNLKPGMTDSLNANSNGGFTRLCIGTTGSEAVKIEIKSKNFNETLDIKPGDCMKLTKSFGKGKILFKNLSTSATISVTSKWL